EPIDNKDEEPVTVSVKKDGTYYITLGGDAEQARPLAEIKEMVSKVLREGPKTLILVQGDHSVDYGVVVSLMSELQSAGAPSVGLVTEPPRYVSMKLDRFLTIPVLLNVTLHLALLILVAGN